MKKHIFRILSMIIVVSVMMTTLLIPASAATYSFSSFKTKVINIEQKAIAFLASEAAPTSATNVNNLVLGYLRSKSIYKDLKWTAVGGPIDSVFVNLVDEAYPTYSNFFQNTGEYLRDPFTSSNIDFLHLCATIDGYISAANPTPDSWSGWAGDCAQLAIEIIKTIDDPDDYNEYLSTAISWMGSSQHSMSIYDILADVDAANIAKMIVDDNMFLSDALIAYYTTSVVNTRYTRFVNSFGAWYDFEADVYDVLDPSNSYVAGYSLMEIMAFNYNAENDPVPTRNQSGAVAGSFVNFILTKANAEGYTYD